MPKITVYLTRYCPFCKNAKELLKKRGIAFEEVDVDDAGDAAWDALCKRSGMDTVPQIFADDRLIGGYTQLAALDAKDQLTSLK